MVSVEGDIIEPYELIAPRVINGRVDHMSGAVFISGTHLNYVDNDGKPWELSGAAIT